MEIDSLVAEEDRFAKMMPCSRRWPEILGQPESRWMLYSEQGPGPSVQSLKMVKLLMLPYQTDLFIGTDNPEITC